MRRPLVFVPLADKRLSELRCSVEEDGTLLVTYDASLFDETVVRYSRMSIQDRKSASVPRTTGTRYPDQMNYGRTAGPWPSAQRRL